MTKQTGAFLTIGELAAELDVPQHILRYWETRFPMLRPLQRAGNRRYYRAEDVALARRIHHLLTVEGYTVRGAQKALAGRTEHPVNSSVGRARSVHDEGVQPSANKAATQMALADSEDVIARLKAIRDRLEAALG